MGRSDHCPCCGCEEGEPTRCTWVCPNPRIRIEINHSDKCWQTGS